jgi:DNA-directed RNA polymerase subunit B"
LTSAVQRGINEAAGDIVVWMDCDLSMPPEKIPELISKIEVKRPMVREADGSQGDLFPAEARLRNLTYAAPIQLEMTLLQGGERHEPVIAIIGQLPIMVGSTSCNLYGLDDEERVEHGEDPLDPGGYFIINGTERVLMTLEDLASNKIMTEFTERYNERIYVAKVFSQFRGYRALIVVERNKRIYSKSHSHLSQVT